MTKEQILHDRGSTYGDFNQNLRLAAQFQILYKKAAGDRYKGGHDAAMNMVFQKLARIACGTFHEDNYVDIGNYIEAAMKFQEED